MVLCLLVPLQATLPFPSPSPIIRRSSMAVSPPHPPFFFPRRLIPFHAMAIMEGRTGATIGSEETVRN